MRIALVGKYVRLEDAYLSVVEALRHAGTHHGAKVEVDWIDSEEVGDPAVAARLDKASGILIPGGFGGRGIEGKIRAAQIAREKKIPYLGICLGMQLAVCEFARHVAGMEGANSTEFDLETPFPVIDLLPEQKEIADMGGTMRLGADPVKLHAGTRIRELYDEPVVYERHRHRYEVNNHLRRRLEAVGLVCSGTSPDERLVEAIELPVDQHPFFVASQYHPEFKSRPERPAPLFREFVGAALEYAGQTVAAAQAGNVRRERGRRTAAAQQRRGRHGPRHHEVRRTTDAERERLHETFAALCRIESPSGRERACADWITGAAARRWASRSRRTTRARAPARTPATCSRGSPAPGAGQHSAVRAHGHGAADRAGRAGPGRRRLGERGEGILGADNKSAVAVDPRGRATRHGGAPSRRRSGSSCCSRSARRCRCAAPRRSTPAAWTAASATCSTTRRRSARSCSRRRPIIGSTPSSGAAPRTRASGPRWAAARSRPPRARSPRCGSAGSTPRPPRTSARSRAGPRST